MLELIERVQGRVAGGGRVVTDSRLAREGDVFVALKGARVDGNDFVGEALERGARFAVTEREGEGGERRVVVPDALSFLQRLARYHRRVLGVPVLGITGTNGKTTTKELCRAVLSCRLSTVATRGNLNNQIGVPLTLLEMNEGTDVGIVEMGASRSGDIQELCAIARPDHGLVTNIGEAHVEGFGGMESIIRAKCELYFCVRGNGGTIFVNGEDALLSRMCKGGARVVYGGKKGVVRGESLGEFPFLACDLVVGEERFRARTRLVGEYNLNNVVAAVAVGMHFGVPPAEAARAIEGYEPSNRSQWLESEWNTIMLDAYNANPSSMKAAVSHFAGMPGENKLLVLGEMLEMGHRSADAHRELLELVESLGLRHAYAVGAAFEGLEGRFPFVRRFGTTGELAEFLREHPVRRSLVLVKGSRGNQLERVIEYL